MSDGTFGTGTFGSGTFGDPTPIPTPVHVTTTVTHTSLDLAWTVGSPAALASAVWPAPESATTTVTLFDN